MSIVKAYLRYVQEKITSGLVGNIANIRVVKIKQPGSSKKTQYLVTACNECINLSNIRTGEVEFQIYDKEAMHGQVTYIATSGSLLAIGYTNGTILVYDLEGMLPEGETLNKLTESKFEQVH